MFCFLTVLEGFSLKTGKNTSLRLSFPTSLRLILSAAAQVLSTPDFTKRQSNVIFTPPNSLTNKPYNTGF